MYCLQELFFNPRNILNKSVLTSYVHSDMWLVRICNTYHKYNQYILSDLVTNEQWLHKSQLYSIRVFLKHIYSINRLGLSPVMFVMPITNVVCRVSNTYFQLGISVINTTNHTSVDLTSSEGLASPRELIHQSPQNQKKLTNVSKLRGTCLTSKYH